MKKRSFKYNQIIIMYTTFFKKKKKSISALSQIPFSDWLHYLLSILLQKVSSVGLAHDVGAQLRNKNGLMLNFLLFLVILKCSGRKTSQD